MAKVAIIGGGIAGSSVGIYLSKLGADVKIFEKKDVLVSGPPMCHLHAGGNLYPEISLNERLQLLKESIELFRFYPDSIDKRPTVSTIRSDVDISFDEVLNSTHHHIVVIPSSDIDKFGISKCMQKALLKIKENIKAESYLFDGNTTFGVDGLTTLIKADATIKEVSAASILAKVTHDRNIIASSKLYPQWEFEKHKGYVTSRHVELIKKYGYSPIHRVSYKIKSLQPTLFDE